MAFYDLTKTGAQIQQILDNALLKTEQTLTPQEQEQVKTNLGITSGGGGVEIPVIVVEGTNVTQELQPNTYYEFGEVTNLTVTFAAEKPNVYNEYMFEFTSGSTATTLSLPSDVKWIGDEAPVIEANQRYQMSIVNGIGAVGKVSSIVELTTELRWTLNGGAPNIFTIDDIPYISSDSSAKYHIGSILKIEKPNTGSGFTASANLFYKSGSSDTVISFSDVEQITIAEELNYISITTNYPGGGF